MNKKEQELKLLLNSEDFNRILTRPPSKVVKQVNYYFDTETFILKNLGITLRIRVENKDVILCMKTKIGGSFFITSNEVEQTISQEDLKKSINEPDILHNYFSENVKNSLMSNLHKEHLAFLGTITNERHYINFNEKFSFELDHSVFPDGSESFELEVEGITHQKECEDIMRALKAQNISFVLNNQSKYERFLIALTTNNLFQNNISK